MKAWVERLVWAAFVDILSHASFQLGLCQTCQHATMMARFVKPQHSTVWHIVVRCEGCGASTDWTTITIPTKERRALRKRRMSD